jgi:nitroreductase
MVHEVGAMPNAAQVASLISGRRSVRRFIDRPVEKEVVEQVLALAAMAPTARNCQSTEFHVITDKKRVSEISSMTAEDLRKLTQMMNGSFGRLMVRMAMGREMYPAVEEIQPMVRYIVGEYEKGIDAVLYNTPVLISFHADPTLAMANENAQLAMQNALLALPVLDLGGFYSGFVPVMAQRNRRLVASLGVPEGHKLYGVLAFGYDGEKTDRYMERRPKVTWQ